MPDLRAVTISLLTPKLPLVFVFSVLALLAQAPGARVEAVTELRVGWMQVAVMPEYDQPRVVVHAQAKLVEPALPADLRLVLPPNATVTHACFLKQPGDEHVCQVFKTTNEEAATILTYQVPVVDFFVEFVYAFVDAPGPRSFDYLFVAPYPTERLEILVQEPLRSRDFAVSPLGISQSTDAQGFRYHNYTYSNVAPGQTFAYQFSYVKDDVRPSVTSAATGDPARLSKYLIYGIVLVGGPLAALAVFASRRGGGRVFNWGAATGSRGPASATAGALGAAGRSGGVAVQPARARGSRTGGGQASAETLDGQAAGDRVGATGTRPVSARFCTNCGAGLSPGGRFCASCGTAVRGAPEAPP